MKYVQTGVVIRGDFHKKEPTIQPVHNIEIAEKWLPQFYP